jgi:cytochrome b561
MQHSGYSRSAVIVHWLLAVSIFFLFVSSWWMLALPLPSQELTFRQFPFQLHKNVGVTIVVLLLLLLYVRFKHRPPAESPEVMRPWMQKMAVVDHVILYVLIFACCFSGYMSSSYSGWPTTLWWLVDLPHWGGENEALNMFWSDVHLWTCWALLAVIAVHIAGALYHAFRNDGVARRMLRL